MKILIILAFILIAQGVEAIEVGLTQESGQIQITQISNNNIMCSAPSDCFMGYFCDLLSPHISNIPPTECYGSRCVYPCDAIVYYDLPLARIEPIECPPLPDSTVVIPKLGSGTFKPPEPESLINTSQWGEVPANQILVVTRKGCSHCIVHELASRLNGEVVGYIDFISLYQIETSGRNEEELREALSIAKADPDILMAFAHQEVFPEQNPLDDPVYSNKGAKSYQIAGVPQSWDTINSSRLSLSDARIGVVDDGLYKGYGEFNGAVRINTKSNGSLLTKPSSDYPIAGSHGTGIMNILAADPDNGGLVGIASEPLRNKLSVTMINMVSPIYSKTGDAWYMGYMLALSQAAIGADILSFSWGNSEADPDAVQESEEFFKEWANTYPDHLFICSAGNDGKAIDGSRRFPYSYHQPNVITVGCINNDGTLQRDSNRISNTFEVTIGVPGDQVIWGKDDKGRIEDSGGETSMSVPFVTATAALVRSLDPSLDASEIKSLLARTARKSIDIGGKQAAAPKEVGGGILATDLAVAEVIASMKNSTETIAS
jgi:hypothetical protein